MISSSDSIGICARIDAQHIVRSCLLPQDSCCFSIHRLIIHGTQSGSLNTSSDLQGDTSLLVSYTLAALLRLSLVTPL